MARPTQCVNWDFSIESKVRRSMWGTAVGPRGEEAEVRGETTASPRCPDREEGCVGRLGPGQLASRSQSKEAPAKGG